MADVTKPIALDETLQDTNTALGLLGKDTTLQAIVTALGNIGINTVGNLASLVTTDKSSLVGAVNEVAGEVDDLNTDKADKVTGATAGNLAGLDSNGNLTDSGWNGAKDITSISGNPISISGLKSNQLAINPIITFEPIETGTGTKSPSNPWTISGYDKVEVLSCGVNVWDEEWEVGTYDETTGKKSSAIQAFRSKNKIRVIPNGQYYFSITSLPVSATRYPRIFKYAANGDYLGVYNLTSPTLNIASDTAYITFRLDTNYGTTYKNDISINYPATETSYIASNKATSISESLGQTVYGGSLDVRTGKLTVDNGYYTFDGTETWQLNSTNGNAQFEKTDMKLGINQSGICSKLARGNSSGNILFGSGNNGIYLLDVINQYSLDTVAKIQAFTTGMQIVYPLAIPFTIQLTPHEIPLLKDYAYVSTNGTSIALDYHNGELASLADVSQLGETVNELGEYVGANDLGSLVTIPESGDFIIPSDGYIRINSGSGSGDFYRVDIYGSKKVASNRAIMKVNSSDSVTSKYQFLSLYVRKGMIAAFAEKNTGNTTGAAVFIPLV